MSNNIYQGHTGNNSWTIFNGDCIQALQQLPPNSIDCIFTSPPYVDSRAYGAKGRAEGNLADYNVAVKGTPLDNEIGQGQTLEEYYNSLRTVINICFDLLKNERCFFINVDKHRKNCQTVDISHKIVSLAKEAGFTHRDTIIWIKSNVRPGLQHVQPYYLEDGWEYVLLFTKGKAKINRTNHFRFTSQYVCGSCGEINYIEKKTFPNYFETNIGFTEERLSAQHPAKFPLAVPRFVLSIGAERGYTILDPFAGIGTTLVAGLEMELNVIGCEINSDFCQQANKEITKRFNQFNLSNAQHTYKREPFT